MTNTEMIIHAITGMEGIDLCETCCLCGGQRTIEKFIPRRQVLSGNFMDHNAMKCKTSEVICDFCRLCLSDELLDSPEGKRCGVRQYSFLVEKDEFRIIDKGEKSHYLFDYAFTPPFILAYNNIKLKNTLAKKHISFKSKINFSGERFSIATEDGNVDFDRRRWRPIYEIVKGFFEKKVFKVELLTCTIPPWKFEKYSLDLKKVQALTSVKNSRQYQLIVNCLQKTETEKTNKERQDE